MNPLDNKTGSFTIEWKGRNLPVDVYHNGTYTRFKITLGDGTETHLFWNGREMNGRGTDIWQPFAPLVEKSFAQFQAPSAESAL